MKLHIIGSGPAGLAAAEAGLAAGAQVCLIDDNPAPGGQIWRGGPGAWTDPRARALWEQVKDHPRLTQLQTAQVVGAVAPGSLLLENETGGTLVQFERLIVCSGAREVVLPFPGWTLPGVTGAGGLQALIKGGMAVRGRQVVVAGSGPLLLATAATALAAGARIEAIVEHQGLSRLSRFGFGLALRHPGKLRQAVSLFAALRGIPYLAAGQIVEARGPDALQRVVVRTPRAVREFACDFLAAGFGLSPNTDLGQLLGCAIAGGAIEADQRQRTSVQHVWAAGECTGIGGVDKALIEGRIAALDALGLAPTARELSVRRQCHDFSALLARSFALRPSLKDMCRPETIVCRCEDVTASALGPHGGWREAKLATRVGMGACQGKTCSAACSFLFDWTGPGARMPIMPASAGALSQIE
ncbi:NAD(P)/FAD-dependent oxidoreductase [Massilia endophytica]|uniref:NAD(P)/FAD-dependent oxidoreductase n=1 Tax=Massilia endophytica TaxID=2899220 RepID=UPI001E3D6326|nr:FAD/NAD(P)-binding oxidoreductase [Massilia endophytica]UGQ48805.1 NAD(P)/FAD-dependent oxidoreductase [Massilia endophytica]